MAQFPGLTLWTDALVADTDHLSDAEFGLYMRILIKMWRTPGCRLPNDDHWIQRHFRSTPDVVRAVFNEFCQTDGNWITQKRLQTEFRRSFEYRGRMSVLRKRKKSKGNDANTARTTPDVEHRIHATLTLPTKEEKKEERTSGENNSPRSLATALPSGALARSAQTEDEKPKQLTDKKPEDMTLAEINAIQWGKR
jgi:uncharacterized protein YdaU (DUF1376 family)